MLDIPKYRRDRMVMPQSEDFGVDPDVSLTLLVAVVCLSRVPDAVLAQEFLCDKTGLPNEPAGETLLLLLIKNYIVQGRGGGYVLTTKGAHLAERVVRKVMAGF